MAQDIPPVNRTIAQRLKEVAELLHSQGSKPFRVQAYHHAAQTLEQLEQPIDHLARTKGIEKLKQLPGIGEGVARTIRELVLRGKLPMLERLRGEAEPESLLATVLPNTALAHQQGKTRNWVVLFFDGREHEAQCTIITTEWGALEGRRIVRGREGECLRYYEKQTATKQETTTSWRF